MLGPGVAYAFGPFRLNPADYQCVRGGVPVAMAPKSLDLLLFLVTRPGALVTKDEIMSALWQDVAVSDNALTQVVSDLRRALDDDPLAPKYVQTVPRRGYRFVGSVEVLTDAPKPLSAQGSSAALPLPSRAGVRETPNLEAYRTFTDGRLKLENMDVRQVPEAIADFERVIALDSRYAPAYVGLAHALFWRHEVSRARNRPDLDALTQAIARAHQAIDLDPDFAEAHAALALMLLSAGRPNEAVAAGRRAVELEPGNWRNHCRLAVAAWGTERLQAFGRVLSLYPDFAYAYYGMAMVFVARGHFRLAEEALRHGIPFQDRPAGRAERFPAAGLHWLLGMIRLAEGDIQEARTEFEREQATSATGIYSPEFAVNACDGLGYVCLHTGDIDGARTMFGRALKSYPDRARSLVGVAVACHRAGLTSDRDAAIAEVQQAIRDLRAGKRMSEAALAAAFGHVLAGRPVEAVAAVKQLLAEAPSGLGGWTIPVEPLLAPLHPDPAFQHLLEHLAERAQ